MNKHVNIPTVHLAFQILHNLTRIKCLLNLVHTVLVVLYNMVIDSLINTFFFVPHFLPQLITLKMLFTVQSLATESTWMVKLLKSMIEVHALSVESNESNYSNRLK